LSPPVSILKFPDNTVKSLQVFVELANQYTPGTPCHLDTLAGWLRSNPGKKIVTDIKERNIAALHLIHQRHSDLLDRFIPQVYNPAEYFQARAMGFKDVIWTLYRYSGDNEKILSYLPSMDLLGLTMDRTRANAGLA
jgi:hypothetical protein